MKFHLFFLFFLMFLPNSITIAQNEIIHSDAYLYLESLREEQEELDFQLQHQEITRPFYKLASTRLAILKELITQYGCNNQMTQMPEYHVITLEELETLIPNSKDKLKKAKPSQLINERWRFIKTVSKGNIFYILERLNDSP